MIFRRRPKPRRIDDVPNSEMISYPVWRFTNSTGQGLDETAILPVQKYPVVDTKGCLFCTDVRLANGDSIPAMIGNFNPRSHFQNSHLLTISIFKGEQRFHLARYFDFHFAENGPNTLATFLGLSLDAIFPIQYDLSRICIGEVDALTNSVEATHKEPLGCDDRLELVMAWARSG